MQRAAGLFSSLRGGKTVTKKVTGASVRIRGQQEEVRWAKQ